jgi:hypothetical protein
VDLDIVKIFGVHWGLTLMANHHTKKKIVTLVVDSFHTVFKNNHLNGLGFHEDFEPMKEVCAFFNGTPVGAYGCFKFELDGHTVFVYNTYGDEDNERHDAEDMVNIASMGFCFYFDKYFYCFDMDSGGYIILFNKTVKPAKIDPDFFSGKRPFYHYNDQGFLSMQGFYESLKFPEHLEAHKWTSGPRTRFELEEYTLL